MDFPSSACEFPTTGLCRLLAVGSEFGAGQTFLQSSDGSGLTYAETEEKVCRAAQWLRANGVEPGDRVALFLANRAEIPILLFAAARIGAVFVVLNDRLMPRGLEKVLCQAEARVLIADASTVERAREADVAIPLRICFDALPDTWLSGETLFDAEPLTDPIAIDEDAPVCLVFTSGSTGAPRGVTLTHTNILFVVEAIQKRLAYRPGDIVGNFLPLSFDYGLYQVFLCALSGSSLYLGNPGQVGPRLPRILEQEGVTVLPGVPTVYSALISLHRRRPFDLPRLRAITNTGERLPLSYIEEMQRMFPGLDVFVMYGLTECKRVSILLPEEFRERPESVGRALDGTEAFAVNDRGDRLPPGSTGQLAVRGPHVAARGYWRSPGETAKRYRREPDGSVTLLTGDNGSVDADGFLYFEARADDLIKHRGNRISPIEIETEACALDGIVEASVLHDSERDRLLLVATVSDSAKTAATILEALGTVLEPAKIPDEVVIRESLPRSMNGKIDRKALRSLLLPALTS